MAIKNLTSVFGGKVDGMYNKNVDMELDTGNGEGLSKPNFNEKAMIAKQKVTGNFGFNRTGLPGSMSNPLKSNLSVLNKKMPKGKSNILGTKLPKTSMPKKLKPLKMKKLPKLNMGKPLNMGKTSKNMLKYLHPAKTKTKVRPGKCGTKGFINPEKSAMKRMNQQIGLKPFKDFDGDGLANILDCNPRDKNKQGAIHKIGNFFKGRGYTENPVSNSAPAPTVRPPITVSPPSPLTEEESQVVPYGAMDLPNWMKSSKPQEAPKINSSPMQSTKVVMPKEIPKVVPYGVRDQPYGIKDNPAAGFFSKSKNTTPKVEIYDLDKRNEIIPRTSVISGLKTVGTGLKTVGTGLQKGASYVYKAGGKGLSNIYKAAKQQEGQQKEVFNMPQLNKKILEKLNPQQRQKIESDFYSELAMQPLQQFKTQQSAQLHETQFKQKQADELERARGKKKIMDVKQGWLNRTLHAGQEKHLDDQGNVRYVQNEPRPSLIENAERAARGFLRSVSRGARAASPYYGVTQDSTQKMNQLLGLKPGISAAPILMSQPVTREPWALKVAQALGSPQQYEQALEVQAKQPAPQQPVYQAPQQVQTPQQPKEKVWSEKSKRYVRYKRQPYNKVQTQGPPPQQEDY